MVSGPHKLTRVFLIAVISVLTLSGCSFNVDVLPETLLTAGSPFVVSGTAVLLDNNGPCPAWVGDNGVTYHLFQGSNIDNDAFDQITTPGVRSRLQITERTDLELVCQVGTLVEVRNVLEIVD